MSAGIHCKYDISSNRTFSRFAFSIFVRVYHDLSHNIYIYSSTQTDWPGRCRSERARKLWGPFRPRVHARQRETIYGIYRRESINSSQSTACAATAEPGRCAFNRASHAENLFQFIYTYNARTLRILILHRRERLWPCQRDVAKANERNDRSLPLHYHVASTPALSVFLFLSLSGDIAVQHYYWMFTRHLTVFMMQTGNKTTRERFVLPKNDWILDDCPSWKKQSRWCADMNYDIMSSI